MDEAPVAQEIGDWRQDAGVLSLAGTLGTRSLPREVRGTMRGFRRRPSGHFGGCYGGGAGRRRETPLECGSGLPP